MKRTGILTAFLGVLFFYGGMLFAKDCPSRLYNNLHQIFDSDFFYGLELKGYYYNVNGTNYYFGGLTSAFTYEGDRTYFNFELRVDPKKYARHESGTERSPFKLRQLNLEQSIFKELSLKIGRQEISYGNGLVLDDFFDGLTINAGKGNKFSAGFAAYSIYSAKEALECQKGFFYNYTNSWKNLRNFDWGDMLMAYLKYSFRIKKNELGLILLRTQNSDVEFRSSVLSFFSRIRIPFNWKLHSEIALQHADEKNDIAWGVSGELFKSFRFNKVGNILTKFQYLYGSINNGTMFSPMFGNIHVGERQHYSVRQGSILGAELNFSPAFFKNGRLRIGYFWNIRNSEILSDELDIGVELNLTKSQRIKLITNYSLWSGVMEGSQIMVNLRVVL